MEMQPGGSTVKNPPANTGDAGPTPGWGRFLEGGTGEIPWTEEPGGLQSMGSQESDTTEQQNNNNRTAGTDPKV